MAKKIQTSETTRAIKAARALLARIDDITTDEFSKGGDKTERDALRAALVPFFPELAA